MLDRAQACVADSLNRDYTVGDFVTRPTAMKARSCQAPSFILVKILVLTLLIVIFRSVDGAVLISVPSSAKAAETCQKIGEQPLNFLESFYYCHCHL